MQNFGENFAFEVQFFKIPHQIHNFSKFRILKKISHLMHSNSKQITTRTMELAVKNSQVIYHNYNLTFLTSFTLWRNMSWNSSMLQEKVLETLARYDNKKQKAPVINAKIQQDCSKFIYLFYFSKNSRPFTVISNQLGKDSNAEWKMKTMVENS